MPKTLSQRPAWPAHPDAGSFFHGVADLSRHLRMASVVNAGKKNLRRSFGVACHHRPDQTQDRPHRRRWLRRARDGRTVDHPRHCRHHVEMLPEVLPTVDPELGALVHAELDRHGVKVHTRSTVTRISRGAYGSRHPESKSRRSWLAANSPAQTGQPRCCRTAPAPGCSPPGCAGGTNTVLGPETGCGR